MSAPVQVILNPNSGGAGKRVLARLPGAFRARGLEFELHRTEGPGHGRALARRIQEDGATHLLCVGGDGTLHQIVNGLLDGSGSGFPALAVIPVGTGNDFHRMVGTDRSVEAALDLVAGGVPVPFDVGRVRWDGGCRHFVNLLGVGVDVEVIRHRKRFRRLPGLTQYTAALFSALVRFRSTPLRIRLDDDRTLEARALLSTVTVGPSVGGGFHLSPEAHPCDGLLDLCFVEELRFGQVLRYLPRVLRGSHGTADPIHLLQLRTASIDSPKGARLAFELDGELMDEEVDRLEVEVLRGRLPVLVTESRARDLTTPPAEASGG